MNENIIVNKCRVCFKEKTNVISLYDECNSMKYSEMLKEYLGLIVEEESKHPCMICRKCVGQLDIIVNFIKRLRISNDKLNRADGSNVPFHKYLCQTLKVEDDENLPLSVVSASLKEEKVEVEPPCDYHTEDAAVDEDFFDTPIPKEEDEEMERKLELSNNFVMVPCEKNGIRRNMVQCLTCGLTLQNKSAFVIHNRRHTGEKPCVCSHCGKRFTQSGTLAEHIRRQHPNAEQNGEGKRKGKNRGEQLYICQYCGKNFTKKNYLTVHVRIHTSEKPYQCSQCPKAFRRCIDFIQHRRIHSGDKPYSCHVCGRCFVSHTALKRHLTVHSDERKFKCNVCNAAVKSSDSLKKHMIVMHTTDRPNVCNICNASFALKYNLKSHMKAKHSEKSGVCNICKKEFSNLQRHLKTHSAEKSFGCLMCNRRFFTEKGLATHSAKHNIENSTFCCTYDNCSAAFPKQSKLDFHILKYHTDCTPHTCQYCSKGFYRLPDLRRHVKSVHPPSKSDLPSVPDIPPIEAFSC